MALNTFFTQVEQNEKRYIQRLSEAVAIPSISGDPSHRQDVVRMGDYLQEQLKQLGASVETRDPGTQDWNNTGLVIPLPPVVLATIGTDPSKKTVLVYGHYDVQPALKEDGWTTDPFTLVVDNDNDKLIGRGSTDDKGPILGWINVVEAHRQLNLDLPVNLKFCLEGMEESGSEGLEKIIHDEAQGYFKDVDAVCISDNYWLGTEKPCLTYGLRGCVYYHLTVSGPAADLHSGVFGGTVHEPMIDLVQLLSKLVDSQGKILIPGIYDKVLPVTEKERKTYENLSFSLQDLADSVGNSINLHSNVESTLQHRWRFPSLSLHGIEGAFYSPGDKTVLPAKVKGKFSIRTVPDMDNDEITRLVKDYVSAEFKKLNSKNTCSVELTHGGDHWLASPDHWNYVAAAKAVQDVFGVEPDLTREGCSIPITLTFQEALNKNVLLLPMGRSDDGAHSINEKLNKSNFINGTKLLGAYLYQVADVKL
ncbi:putative glutamate carboxypeptidase [Chlamydoabsidia padenii]|nr:putative glutamate carboxypeptidase [Chlamydoabsidia padenii]